MLLELPRKVHTLFWGQVQQRLLKPRQASHATQLSVKDWKTKPSFGKRTWSAFGFCVLIQKQVIVGVENPLHDVVRCLHPWKSETTTKKLSVQNAELPNPLYSRLQTSKALIHCIQWIQCIMTWYTDAYIAYLALHTDQSAYMRIHLYISSIHTCIHTCSRTFVHGYVHGFVHAYTYACLHAHTVHVYLHTTKHTPIHRHFVSWAYSCMQTIIFWSVHF